MCWLVVIFTALLCSQATHCRPSGGDEANKNVKTVDEQVKAAMDELQLAERLEEMGNSTRESRGLLKKVAFLAGMRVGGLVQSSGTLAASNSLRVFGKVVNSALSISYGNAEDLVELPGLTEDGSHNPYDRPIEEHSVKIITNETVPTAAQIEEGENKTYRQIKNKFLAQHNALVERANGNSKFLRMPRASCHKC